MCDYCGQPLSTHCQLCTLCACICTDDEKNGRVMYYSIRSGTDGIGLDFDFGVFADDIAQARTEAAEMLRNRGFDLQADTGLFTVHGHPAWILSGNSEIGYSIVPLDEKDTETMARTEKARKLSIITLDAHNYAERIDEFTSNRPTLTSAEADVIETEIDDRTGLLIGDVRALGIKS